jgi:hypothetical protein
MDRLDVTVAKCLYVVRPAHRAWTCGDSPPINSVYSDLALAGDCARRMTATHGCLFRVFIVPSLRPRVHDLLKGV